ncbi:hypothetical protein [Sulfolobus tengchongensis spindle-shaped virus 4]|nr:hypothetical protein [Sulfolobus tengchongensis spindle-shaped virus 4]
MDRVPGSLLLGCGGGEGGLGTLWTWLSKLDNCCCNEVYEAYALTCCVVGGVTLITTFSFSKFKKT